jgi:hemolysin III
LRTLVSKNCNKIHNQKQTHCVCGEFRYTNRVMTPFREPINAITHLIGAMASLIGLLVLIVVTREETGKLITMLIYGFSMILLFVASTLLHGVETSSKKYLMQLNRLDHMAIFLLIAGTYTPIVYNFFLDPWRWIVLALVWFVTIVGVLYKLFSPRIHGVFNASIYLILSWGGAVPLIFALNLSPLISTDAFYLLIIGGLIYTIGFLVYFFEKPDPWPNVFGHHEIWHLFVLCGTLCHYFFMLFFVVPHDRVI